MLNMLYCTDLHGNIERYNKILKFAVDERIPLIHLGADLLPKGPGISGLQKEFIKRFLKEFYVKAISSGIRVFAFFGNDDLPSRKKYFRQYATLLDETIEIAEGYEFVAYPFVPDYPFGLKDSCKLERAGWQRPYCGRPLIDNNGRLEDIEDVDSYFLKKGTIEEDLVKFSAPRHSVVAFHCPPSGGDLDVCCDRRAVGSNAILQWIERNQPMLVLCGHIHESPEMTGKLEVEVGRSIVIQPGDLHFVRVSIDDSEVKREYIAF